MELTNRQREELRTQISRIRVLNDDKTLAEKVQTLFREYYYSAIGMTISTLVLALTGGGTTVTPAPSPTPDDKGGLKEWVKINIYKL